MNRFSKSSAAVLIFSSLFLTGCEYTAPADTSSPAASPAVSSPASAAPENLEDVHVVPSNILRPGEKVDPAVRDGINVSLDVLTALTDNEAFYEVRGASNDWKRVDKETPIITGLKDDGTLTVASSPALTAQMTDRLREDLKANVSEEGRLTAIPTANSQGTFGIVDGVDADPTGEVQSVWSNPTFLETTDPDGSGKPAVYIQGKRTMTFDTESGASVKFEAKYSVGAIQSASGEWLVDFIDFDEPRASVVKATS